MIPRRVHRVLRAKYLGSGATSFASYVTWWLAQVPEAVTASQLLQVMAYEVELKCLGSRRAEVR